MLKLGALILVGSWVPLLVAGFVLGMDNPVGLGLLAWAGSLLGLGLIGLGAAAWLLRLVRGR